jgi:hypothetical protein
MIRKKELLKRIEELERNNKTLESRINVVEKIFDVERDWSGINSWYGKPKYYSATIKRILDYMKVKEKNIDSQPARVELVKKEKKNG